MCDAYGNRVPYSVYVEEFSQLRLPPRFPVAAPNLEPRDDIRPTDIAPVIRLRDDGVELSQLRWGFPAGRPKAGPVINFLVGGTPVPVRRGSLNACFSPAELRTELGVQGRSGC